ncbi:hypothetical protein GCM10010254_10230 [Streptomyces chromofuscus]|nr:hypothetical protein GCM10010254_10230 [Streptomyces chromofuscus]
MVVERVDAGQVGRVIERVCDQPVRELLGVGAGLVTSVVMDPGEVGTDLPEPSVGVVDALHDPGQQPDRLSRQDRRGCRPARTGQRPDRGHRLPGLVRVGAGVGVLDVAVPGERADIKQFTDT